MSHPAKLTLGGAGLEKTVPGSMRRQPLPGGAHGHTERDKSGIEEKSGLNDTLAQVDKAADRTLGGSEG
jgi:hypothetical protein